MEGWNGDRCGGVEVWRCGGVEVEEYEKICRFSNCFWMFGCKSRGGEKGGLKMIKS
jgi:hypothetical protein